MSAQRSLSVMLPMRLLELDNPRAISNSMLFVDVVLHDLDDSVATISVFGNAKIENGVVTAFEVTGVGGRRAARRTVDLDETQEEGSAGYSKIAKFVNANLNNIIIIKRRQGTAARSSAAQRKRAKPVVASEVGAEQLDY